MTNRMQEVSFRSQALNREMPYLVVLPKGYDQDQERYPVLYLLHGWNGDCRNWCTLTNLLEYARDSRFLIVTPEGQNSWYVNSATNPKDRFYDYLSRDLIAEVDARYRTLPHRERRAMAGLSMGGYGSFLASLNRPDMFSFVGSVSGAFNAPSGIEQVLPDVAPSIKAAYGEPASSTRRRNDLFTLLENPPSQLPYFFVQCGIQDPLLPANRRLVAQLSAKRIPYEYHELPGDHTWEFWDSALQHILHLVAERFVL